METHDGTDHEISTSVLAEWIEHQGADRWWRVDGDPILTGLLALPGPGDELADILRTIHRPLLVHGRDEGDAPRGGLTWKDLDNFIEHFGAIAWGLPPKEHDRVLVLRWKGGGDEWFLIEDDKTSEMYRREALGQGKDS